MKALKYTLEMDEFGYSVCDRFKVIALFSNLEDALNAKREFEQKPTLSNGLKRPPNLLRISAQKVNSGR